MLDAMRNWRVRYGRLPSPYDWSRTHAVGAGGGGGTRASGPKNVVRAERGHPPFAAWAGARAEAARRAGEVHTCERQPAP